MKNAERLATTASARKATWYVRQAASWRDLAAARDLFREYQEWLDVDLCFQGFFEELASLPGAYAPPRGRLLIAERVNAPGAIAGCVALRPLDDQRCEMKRLFVRLEHQGAGIGRRLVDRVIAEAKAIGYRSIVLDTLPQMGSAQRLYGSLGFRDVDAYYHNPTPGVRYLGLDLARA